MSEKNKNYSKTPPDKAGSSDSGLGLLYQRLPKTRRCTALALMLILQMTRTQAVCTNPTTLTAPANPSVTSYQIGTTAVTWNVPAYTQGLDCTFTETLTLTRSPTSATWVTLTGRTIQISTTDTSLHGTVGTFTVTSAVDDSAGTSNSSYTFTITLNNPCLLTPPTASDYTYNIGTGPY